MSKPDSLDLIQYQAAKYVARVYSGDLSATEEQTIRDWCAADPKHQNEFDHMIDVWDTSRELYEETEAKLQVRGYKVAFSIAASAMITLAVILSILLPGSVFKKQGEIAAEIPNAQPQQILAANRVADNYKTRIGEVKNVMLPDGSLVELNTNTEIRLDFNDSVRKVILVQGEAFFAVAKNPSKVFMIDTGERTIRVIGTQFNVRKQSQSLQIAVKEGLVAVHPTSEQHIAFEHKSDDILLTAGTIGAFSGEGQLISRDQSDKVDRLQSWRFGLFRFDNESMETVVAELNRYQPKHIILLDDEVKSLRISGVYSLTDQDNLFKALEQVLPIRVTTHSQQILIQAKKS